LDMTLLLHSAMPGKYTLEESMADFLRYEAQ
jgi:hypothetical protein